MNTKDTPPPPRRQLRSFETVTAEIILLSQFRDAVRAISPRFYRSVQHRDEVYMAIIEALEDLEDELEEIEESMDAVDETRLNSPKIK
jgi:type III secretion protein W